MHTYISLLFPLGILEAGQEHKYTQHPDLGV